MCCARSKHVRRDRDHELQMFIGRLSELAATILIVTVTVERCAIGERPRDESIRTRDRYDDGIAFTIGTRARKRCARAPRPKPESTNDKTDRAPNAMTAVRPHIARRTATRTAASTTSCAPLVV
jgi:hypothetical protein